MNLERAYIAHYDTRNKGYNIRDGGGAGKHSEQTIMALCIIQSGSNNPMFGKKQSSESRRKMSQSHKGKKQRPHTEATKRKIRATLTGVKHSAERRKKNSEANKRTWIERRKRLK